MYPKILEKGLRQWRLSVLKCCFHFVSEKFLCLITDSWVSHHRHSFLAFISRQLLYNWTHAARSLRAILKSSLGFLDLFSRVALNSFQPPCQVTRTTVVIIEMFLMIKSVNQKCKLNSTIMWLTDQYNALICSMGKKNSRKVFYKVMTASVYLLVNTHITILWIWVL